VGSRADLRGGADRSQHLLRSEVAAAVAAVGARRATQGRRLAENEIVASVGSKGDSYDNALAESFYGLYKWELIYRRGPWRGLDDVEFATMTYVDWFNHRRLHGEITNDANYTTPAEHETAHYHHNTPALEPVTQ
jgi:putative transposase